MVVHRLQVHPVRQRLFMCAWFILSWYTNKNRSHPRHYACHRLRPLHDTMTQPTNHPIYLHRREGLRGEREVVELLVLLPDLGVHDAVAPRRKLQPARGVAWRYGVLGVMRWRVGMGSRTKSPSQPQRLCLLVLFSRTASSPPGRRSAPPAGARAPPRRPPPAYSGRPLVMCAWMGLMNDRSVGPCLDIQTEKQEPTRAHCFAPVHCVATTRL